MTFDERQARARRETTRDMVAMGATAFLLTAAVLGTMWAMDTAQPLWRGILNALEIGVVAIVVPVGIYRLLRATIVKGLIK